MKKDNTTPHLSSEYDQKIIKTIPYYDLFHIETINLLKAAEIKIPFWLDTGCGTGTLIQKALQEFPQTSFLLADPSPAMLEEAKKKFTGQGKNRVCFLEPVPAQDLSPALCGPATVITAIQCLHYLSPVLREQAIKRCYSLLEKNGIFVYFENIRPLTEKGTGIGKRNWRNFQLTQGRTEQTVNEHLDRFNKEYFPITIEEHLAMLRRTGFQDVELFWFSYMQAGFYAIK